MKGRKLLYKPVGLAAGVGAGLIAGYLFKKVWQLAAGHENECPARADQPFQSMNRGFINNASMCECAVVIGGEGQVSHGEFRPFRSIQRVHSAGQDRISTVICFR